MKERTAAKDASGAKKVRVQQCELRLVKVFKRSERNGETMHVELKLKTQIEQDGEGDESDGSLFDFDLLMIT